MFIFSKISKLIELKQKTISGMTVQQMANEMAIPLSTLNNIKNGLAVPGVDKLEVIARYFSVDMNYFFDIQSEKKETENVRITDATEYMLKRFEEVIQENALLKHKLEAYAKAEEKSYTLQDVPFSKVAETTVELKK